MRLEANLAARVGTKGVPQDMNQKVIGLEGGLDWREQTILQLGSRGMCPMLLGDAMCSEKYSAMTLMRSTEFKTHLRGCDDHWEIRGDRDIHTITGLSRGAISITRSGEGLFKPPRCTPLVLNYSS